MRNNFLALLAYCIVRACGPMMLWAERTSLRIMLEESRFLAFGMRRIPAPLSRKGTRDHEKPEPARDPGPPGPPGPPGDLRMGRPGPDAGMMQAPTASDIRILLATLAAEEEAKLRAEALALAEGIEKKCPTH